MNDRQVENNKDLVRRFNMELIARGNRGAFAEIVADDFVNHDAPPEQADADVLASFIFDMLRVAMPDIRVEIADMMAEGDKVVTRKVFRGTFAADLLGMPTTGRVIAVNVIDIFTVRNGRLTEHWGLNNFAMTAAAATPG